MLRPVPPDPDGELLALRIPATSAPCPALDALVPPASTRLAAGRQRSDT